MLPADAQAVCGSQLVAGIGLTLAFGWMVPGIDNWAHLGGLAGGAAVGLLLKPQSPASDLALRVDHSLLAALGVVCFGGMAALNYYPRWQRVLALESDGNRLLAARQLEAAKLQFEHAKEIEPADCRLHVQLSSIYVSLGQERQAREEWRWALQLNPEIRGHVDVASSRTSPRIDRCQR
jgi:rhomboid protease GluP